MRDFLRQFLACRVCWRITLSVFALILAVEIAILVPSARQFERNERQLLAERAQVLVEPALARAQGLRQAPELNELIGSYGVRGIALYAGESIPVAAAGDAPPRPQADLGMHALAIADGAQALTLIAAWESPSLPGIRVAVRKDADAIGPSVRSYQWRVAGLVLIIVLVVTAGTMLVMYTAVLRPVLRLRQSSLLAGADPAAAERQHVPTTRQDEIGQLIDAHNAMLAKISESARFVSRHDPLTGLPNRAALTEFLDRECERWVATLLLANVVQFRAINAGFGTSLGDRVIHGLASRLKAISGAGDFIAHLGADRLALVRSGALAPDQASVLAEGLLRQLAQPFEFAGGVSVSPEVRVGIAQSGADVRDVQRTADTLSSLRELGVRVSIDDFGTGYSSLNYLRRFAVDAIKIDKSFVDDIGRDRNAEAICDAVLRLGQSLGTKVVAEGVETEVQAQFLRQRRCDEVQGYLYGRPVPAEEFERSYLSDRAAAQA